MSQFGINLIWTSQLEYPSRHRQRAHIHSFFHYIYILDGEGGICIGNEAFALLPGRIYLTPPASSHNFYNNTDAPLRTLEVKFEIQDKSLARRLLALPAFLPDKYNEIQKCLLEIHREVATKRLFSRDILSAKMYEFAFLLQRSAKEGADALSGAGDSAANLQSVLRYVQEHIGEEITLEDLAKAAHLEKTYFSKKFKKITGMPPMRYVRSAKIEKASDLLVYSDMSISQIAKALGFQSLQHFNNAFRKSNRISPRDYRKKYAVNYADSSKSPEAVDKDGGSF